MTCLSLRGNFPSTMTSSEIKKCIYHPETNPFCPIFRVGEILNSTGQSVKSLADKVSPLLSSFITVCSSLTKHWHEFIFTHHFWTIGFLSVLSPPPLLLLHQGGEIGINIAWICNLDLNVENCVPNYSFTRLDLPFAKNAVSKGYNFRSEATFLSLTFTNF